MDLNPDILHRFFKGKYSRKDYMEVKSVFSDLKKRAGLKSYLKKHWDEFSETEMPGENIEQILHQIHHKIRIEESYEKRYSFVAIFQKVAAILIIPLLLSFFAVIYFQSEKQTTNTTSSVAGYAEIQCPLGVRTKFKLPDGTLGFLNSGSYLKYPVDFTNGRKVTVSGEACFDVFHDESNPFMVETQNLRVKVLGTKFNIIAYSEDTNEEVVLNRGKVEITTPGGQNLSVLHPNQKLVLNTEKGTFKTSEVEANQYLGWTEGKLIFRNENMLQVVARLGRWYNVDIEIKDKELYKYAFRATFQDESLEQVLKLLALTAPFTYEEQPRVVIDNAFQKRKFLLKLDKNKLRSFN